MAVDAEAVNADDRIEVATVTHRTRVSLAFALVAGLVLYFAFWVTATPRRWVPVLLGAACGGVLFALLR